MTKEAALQSFFSSFGIPAYPSTAVPEDCEFPWLTYELVTDNWTGGDTSLTVNLWYYTTSEAEPTAKANEIAKKIDNMKPLKYDGGSIWFKRGHPWCQSLQDSNEENIKRRYMNVTVEYLSEL